MLLETHFYIDFFLVAGASNEQKNFTNKQSHNNNYADNKRTFEGIDNKSMWPHDTDNSDDRNANFWSKFLFSNNTGQQHHRTIPTSMDIASGSGSTKALKFLSLQEHDETTQLTLEER